MKATSNKISAFRKTIWEHYARNKRDLPWRNTADPYRIWVSEVMLQQTQAERVIPKYSAFLKRFPNIRALAKAPFRDVLLLWQGLGYNRRARALQETAKMIVDTYSGVFPKDKDTLMKLPGIGPYTAGAILVFAYGKEAFLLETNIRRVYLRTFFPKQTNVRDADIVKVMGKTLDRPYRDWFNALMDYGAFLKGTGENDNKRSRHYVRQSAFSGSERQVRGGVIRLLAQKEGRTLSDLSRSLNEGKARVSNVLSRLECEGMILKKKGIFFIAS